MKKKGLLIFVTIIILGISGGYFYMQSMLNRMPKTELPKTNEELGIAPEIKEKKEDIVNIAFFGLDARNPDVASRSDSIMVVTIDRKNQKVKATSLMRDMYVPIPGKGSNRINAAHAFGGPALAVKTINSNFGLDIRNYVAVDFYGLEDLIDRVGGVRINVSDAEAKVLNNYINELNRLNGDKVEYVKGGNQVLNGRQAVAYSRIRYVGHGDYERTERQRRVLNEVFKGVKSQNITKLPGLVSSLLPYVETSLPNGEIMELAMDAFKFNTDSLEQFRLPVDGTFKSQSIKGMSVLVPNIEENKIKLKEFIYGAQAGENLKTSSGQ